MTLNKPYRYVAARGDGRIASGVVWAVGERTVKETLHRAHFVPIDVYRIGASDQPLSWGERVRGFVNRVRPNVSSWSSARVTIRV
jgi:type II secretory pathway component PulF